MLAATSPKSKSKRVDNAYQRLKAEILEGVLPPGFQAAEPDIASRLGMSRTPVREALIRLEADGLVDLVPRRGAKVLPIARKDICEIYQILSALEGLSARIAARADLAEAQLADVDVLLDRMDAALAKGDIETWAVLDDGYHRRIAGLGGNARLEEEVTGFLDRVYRANTVLLRLNRGPAANAEDHRTVLEAIRRGDEAEAAETARLHRLAGLARMKEILDSCGLSQV